MDALIAGDATGHLATILRVVSVLSRDGVERSILHRLDAGPAIVDAATDEATRACLLNCSIDGEVLTVHRLTGRVIREQYAADPQSGAHIVRVAFDIVHPDLSVDTITSEHQRTVRAAVGHLEALSTEACNTTIDSETTALVLSWRSRGIWDLTTLGRNLRELIDMSSTTVADCERVLGPDHPNTLTSRNNLASAYRSAGQLDKAIPLLEDTRTECERVLGPDHPITRVISENLQIALRAVSE
ncbi:tetratricopeptide repeat protein [Nocardia sp. NPDC058705]|uniref:tetratricopeptide repeat protein n=1 Tax=Nocardia sp. NPDC058705 TaxID=3346609 RepID=UPI003684D18E